MQILGNLRGSLLETLPLPTTPIFDTNTFQNRISNPEDVFYIENIDVSGASPNILNIGITGADYVTIGRTGVGTYVSGVLSSAFFTGTYRGDGSLLSGVVTQVVAGPRNVCCYARLYC